MKKHSIILTVFVISILLFSFCTEKTGDANSKSNTSESSSSTSGNSSESNSGDQQAESATKGEVRLTIAGNEYSFSTFQNGQNTLNATNTGVNANLSASNEKMKFNLNVIGRDILDNTSEVYETSNFSISFAESNILQTFTLSQGNLSLTNISIEDAKLSGSFIGKGFFRNDLKSLVDCSGSFSLDFIESTTDSRIKMSKP